VSPRATFLRSKEADDALEAGNQVFWDCLMAHIGNEIVEPFEIKTILDVGCHTGGLLQLLAKQWRPKQLLGIEPLESARKTAHRRLQNFSDQVQVLEPKEWNKIPDRSIDLLTCHEVLYLIEDLSEFFGNVKRVLTNDGMAFIVLGCHAENPLFGKLCGDMVKLGHRVNSHRPLDIMFIASNSQLKGFVQPLRTHGWILPDISSQPSKIESLGLLMEHHYKQKLIFLFCHQDQLSIHK
jgi:SAM-dependent methyltransferase